MEQLLLHPIMLVAAQTCTLSPDLAILITSFPSSSWKDDNQRRSGRTAPSHRTPRARANEEGSSWPKPRPQPPKPDIRPLHSSMTVQRWSPGNSTGAVPWVPDLGGPRLAVAYFGPHP